MRKQSHHRTELLPLSPLSLAFGPTDPLKERSASGIWLAQLVDHAPLILGLFEPHFGCSDCLTMLEGSARPEAMTPTAASPLYTHPHTPLTPPPSAAGPGHLSPHEALVELAVLGGAHKANQKEE